MITATASSVWLITRRPISQQRETAGIEHCQGYTGNDLVARHDVSVEYILGCGGCWGRENKLRKTVSWWRGSEQNTVCQAGMKDYPQAPLRTGIHTLDVRMPAMEMYCQVCKMCRSLQTVKRYPHSVYNGPFLTVWSWCSWESDAFNHVKQHELIDFLKDAEW